jgi:hypothetical protein
VRFGASPVGAAWRDEGAINYSGWWTAETINPFYQAQPTFVWDFVATQPNMTVWIEMASTYPYPNNAFFFDLPGLFATSETSAAPAPAATTAPAAAGSGQVAAPAVAAQPAATIPPPTPREDGSIVHVVQPGDSMWVIAIQYAETLGMAPADALPHLQELNDNPAFLNPGDEILIQAGTPATEEAPTEAATAEGTAEGEAPAEGEATPSAEATAASETEAEAEADTEAAADFEPVEQLAGTICVGAFLDANADGQRNDDEALVPNAAIAIARGGSTVSTYITDGESEPFCFELTQADSYELQLYPPAGFAATTEDNWAVSIANGESYTVSFGLSETDQAVSDASRTETTEVTAEESETAAEETTAAEEDGGISNLGLIVMGVAGVLVVLAIVGVFLLRRG